MKLSPKTKQILKNFVRINQSLHIPKSEDGKKTVVKTCNAQTEMIATVTIDEVFDHPITFYQAGEFIKALPDDDTLETTVKVEPNMMVVCGDKDEASLLFADLAAIVKPSKTAGETLPDTVVSFEIKRDVLAKVINMASIMSLKDIIVGIDGDEVCITVSNKINPNSNTYKTKNVTTVSNTGNMKNPVRVKKELIENLIPDDYLVEVRGDIGFKFISKSFDSLYYVIGALRD